MKKIVVIGNGMVGYKFCEKFVAKGGMSSHRLTVFGAEPRAAYDRVHLSEYFSDRNADKLAMCEAQWYAEQGIELVLKDAVMSINPHHKTVTSHSGRTEPYDTLILATGSACFMPSIEG